MRNVFLHITSRAGAVRRWILRVDPGTRCETGDTKIGIWTDAADPVMAMLT
jgi:hypothetical protein